MKKFNNALFVGNYPTPNGYLGTGMSGTTQNQFNNTQYLGIDSSNDHLFVSDYDTNRVMLFKNAQNKINSSNADVVFGQVDFTSSSTNCNQNTLYNPIESYYDVGSDSLFVSDSYHYR